MTRYYLTEEDRKTMLGILGNLKQVPQSPLPAPVNRTEDADGILRPAPTPAPKTVQDSGFVFGTASLNELKGVDKRLVACTALALKYSTQDFCVYDGIRTYKEQERHVKNGTSQTMASKHLEGLAVDLVPWIESGPSWNWESIYPIAAAMDLAATELGIANLITWGGVWDKKLSDYSGNYKKAVEDYIARRKAAGKSAFIDGPHFEILK